MEFQKSIEQKAWHLAGKLKSTGTRMIDFTQSKVSSDIPKLPMFLNDFG
jgi:uncharacterized FAD-dependent dehydrogenase